MSMSHPVRFAAFALVAAAVWLVTGHKPTVAQAPPAGTDAENRLQAVEQKLDRLLNKLDPQKVAATKAEIDKQVELIVQARDILSQQLEQHDARYAEFRKQNPLVMFRDTMSPLRERMIKAEAERADAQRRIRELSANAKTVEKALSRDKNDDVVPTWLMLKRRGVDLSKLPGVPENDAAAQLRVYLRSLQLEIEEHQELIQAAEDTFSKAQNQARELSTYEAEEERLKSRISATRQLFDNIIKRLNDIQIQRAMQP